jgi:N-acyl-D-amino-acid deacylase
VFDGSGKPAFDNPDQLAAGVEQVLVNGHFALRNGQATGAATGRVIRGRAWTGAPGGGCKAAAADWKWIGLSGRGR